MSQKIPCSVRENSLPGARKFPAPVRKNSLLVMWKMASKCKIINMLVWIAVGSTKKFPCSQGIRPPAATAAGVRA